MNCIICGKEITQSYADSRFLGVYCRSCANNSGITTEQINEFKDQQIAELKAENERLQQQLKQSQKQLAIEELEKLREYIVLNDEYDEEIGCNIIKTFDLIEDLADKIKSLKGEE